MHWKNSWAIKVAVILAIAQAAAALPVLAGDLSKSKPLTVTSFPFYPTRVCFSPDEKHLAISFDSSVGGWVQLGTAQGRAFRKAAEQPKGLADVVFSPDGKTMATSSCDGNVVLFNFPELNERLKIGPGKVPTRFASRLAFSPDSKIIALGREGDGIIRLCSAATGETLRDITGHAHKRVGVASISALAFSPNGRFLALGSWDNSLRVWDVDTGEQCWLFSKRGGVNQWRIPALQFSIDGRMLAAVGPDNRIWVWEVLSGQVRCKAATDPFLYNGGDIDRFDMFSGHHQFLAVSNRLVAKIVLGRQVREGTPIPCTVSVFERPRSVSTAARVVPQPPPADFDSLYAAVGSDDAAAAHAALLCLADHGDDAVVRIDAKLRRLPDVFRQRAAEVAKLIGDLDSDRFAVREQAGKELRSVAWFDPAALRTARDSSKSDEVRGRAHAISQIWRSAPIPAEILICHRLIEMLELIGSDKSKEILDRVADTFPAEFAAEARASLRRLPVALTNHE